MENEIKALFNTKHFKLFTEGDDVKKLKIYKKIAKKKNLTFKIETVFSFLLFFSPLQY